jgi:hypothetical protein
MKSDIMEWLSFTGTVPILTHCDWTITVHYTVVLVLYIFNRVEYRYCTKKYGILYVHTVIQISYGGRGYRGRGNGRRQGGGGRGHFRASRGQY